MAEQHKRRRRRKKKGQNATPLLLGLLLVMFVFIGLAWGLRTLLDSIGGTPETPTNPVIEIAATEAPSLETTPETQPTPDYILSRASIAVTGDILMHTAVIESGLQADGSYQFDNIFRYLKPYTQKADLAIANLETTLCGTSTGYTYAGYPTFNCPDAILDAMKNAGFDMLLTANNHCYDTKEFGFLRTVKTIRENGMKALGTMESTADPKYTIENLNGIKVGLICYTYQGTPEKADNNSVYMNRVAMTAATAPLINSFRLDKLDSFYQQVRSYQDRMRSEGAEATVIFMHWGTEYETFPTAQQAEIAQKLCDIGFDAIVGGHPHVIQPMDMLISTTNPNHSTVCLYSTGNAVSNQRIAEMDMKTGHTEDGLLFTMTFAKYMDNTVRLENVEVLPCWVDLRDNGKTEYSIIPLQADLKEQWAQLYNLTDEAAQNAQKSYDRTMGLTGLGLKASQAYLKDQNAKLENLFTAQSQPAA